MRPRRLSWSLFFWGGIILPLGSLANNAAPTKEKKQIVDRVVAIVGKEPVLKSEVDSLLGESKDDLTAHKRAIEALTADKLIANEIKKLGMDVTEDEIDQTVKSVMKQYNLDKDSFPKALRAQGLEIPEYRDQLKKQLYKMKLVQAKIKSRVKITDEDVKNAYALEYGQDATDFKIHLHHLLFKGKTGVSKQKAEAAIKKLKSGENFFALAKKIKSANVIEGDFGVVSKGELLSEFETVAFSLAENSFGGPIESSDGYHVLYVSERVPVEKIPLEKVEKDLHKQLYEKEVERAFRQYVEELRASAYVEVHDAARK